MRTGKSFIANRYLEMLGTDSGLKLHRFLPPSDVNRTELPSYHFRQTRPDLSWG